MRGWGAWLAAMLTIGGCPAGGGSPADPDAGSAVPASGIALGCPTGMSPVHGEDPADVRFCIDTYEAVAEGDLGSWDQHAAGAVPATGMACAERGALPTTSISFDQAMAVCANTPVFDAGGREVGRKRLPLHREWSDAADGVLGHGGSIYPYGDELDAKACATPDAQGNDVVEELQPAGTYARCKSGFGVYDQCGNAWEWVDSGMRTDHRGWLTLAAAAGHEPAIEPDHRVRVRPGTAPEAFQLNGLGVDRDALDVDDQGYLVVHRDRVRFPHGGSVKGYLRVTLAAASDGAAHLPVVVRSYEAVEGSRLLPVKVIAGDDGLPIPYKSGASYYACLPTQCDTRERRVGHYRDFVGTIGFRCAADPIAVAPP